MEKSTKKNKAKKRQQLQRNIAKYSGMSFKMAAIILAGVYGGKWIDEKLNISETPWFTILFSLIAVAGSMYSAIKDLTSNDN